MSLNQQIENAIQLNDEELKMFISSCIEKGGPDFTTRFFAALDSIEDENFHSQLCDKLGNSAEATVVEQSTNVDVVESTDVDAVESSEAEEVVDGEALRSSARIRSRDDGAANDNEEGRVVKARKTGGASRVTNHAVKFAAVVHVAEDLVFQAPLEIGTSDSLPLVNKVAFEGASYDARVAGLLEDTKRWEMAAVACAGRVVERKIALAMLSESFDGTRKEFARKYNVGESSMRFIRNGAKRMARLALEISPGLWSNEIVVKAWDGLCQMKENEFETHFEELKKRVVKRKLESGGSRGYLTGVRKYATEILKTLN